MDPLPLDDRVAFESAFLNTPSARAARLETLAEIYAEALEELRARRDVSHAALIARLEALHKAVRRELRYIRTAGDPPVKLG